MPTINIDKSLLLDLVHDHWFDLNALQFDSEKKEVLFSLGKSRRGPFNELSIKITGVMEVVQEDKAKIGIYDLDDIEISSSFICIKSGFPLKINLRVGSSCSIFLSRAANGNDTKAL
ncbi:MAG: hypothetical protein NW701_03350 [Nitrospira sp.]